MFCRDWLAQLEQHHAQIDKLGFQSVAVAQGKPRHAVRYCGDLAPSIDCLVKPDTVAYDAYGLRQGKMNEVVASVDVLKAGFKALTRGNMQGKAIGDVMMLPGTFLIDTDGIVQYAFYSKHSGDHPDWSELTTQMQALIS
ncbi:MAG: AhpC/TSA family protein [Aggregatilineales bacterium]